MKLIASFFLVFLVFSPSLRAVSSGCAQGLRNVHEPRVDSKQALQLYNTYIQSKNTSNAQAARDALIEFLYPLARSLAYSYARPRGLRNTDDLVQDATIGMIQAIDSFDPNQGEILSYFSKRSFGAMIDAQRQTDWVPRLIRSRNRDLEQLKQSYIARYGVADPNAPTFEDYVRSEVPDERQAALLLKDSAEIHVMRTWTAVESQTRRFDSSSKLEDLVTARSDGPPPDFKMNREDVWQSLSRKLSPIDQTIFEMYFRHNQTMKTIADHLGLSEARISQRMKNIIQLMKLKFHDFPHYREDLLEIDAQGH